MDGQRFDEIIQTWTRTGSRRAAAKTIAGGALATLLAALGRHDAAAKCVAPGKTCKGKKGKKRKCCGGASCKGGNCTCGGGLEACDGQCVDLMSDLDHCGACGDACASNEICQYGHCCTKVGEAGPHNACCSGFVCNPPGQNCVCVS